MGLHTVGPEATDNRWVTGDPHNLTTGFGVLETVAKESGRIVGEPVTTPASEHPQPPTARHQSRDQLQQKPHWTKEGATGSGGQLKS